jgi:hypothetical protein
MPKRSNEFQKIVFAIKKHLASNATVTESKSLPDRITGKQREIDVYIEGTVDGETVNYSIECCDYKRRATVIWIDAMLKKHERLPTDVLILAARNGFTPEAERVAKAHKARLLKFENLKDNKIASLFKEISSLVGKTFSLTPTHISVELAASDGFGSEVVPVRFDTNVVDQSGNFIVMMGEIVRHICDLACRDHLILHGNESHNGFEAQWGVGSRPREKALYLEKIEPHVLRPIVTVYVLGSCKFVTSEFPIKRGHLGDIEVAYAQGTLMDKQATLITSKALNGEEKMTVIFGKSSNKLA